MYAIGLAVLSGGFRSIFSEPEKQHSYQVNVPSMSQMKECADTMIQAASQISEDCDVNELPYENSEESAPETETAVSTEKLQVNLKESFLTNVKESWSEVGFSEMPQFYFRIVD
ncbi:MAG: hypothetical protein IKP69_12105 [Oscillospiraceae bacterium]|nr:hypothetical protein [Oscillospiraceae bacterium]